MKEEFLHYLWRFHLLQNQLYTTENEKIEVLNPGLLNSDAGPDFIQAKIKIDETVWAGSVEMHLKASDWIRHRHQFDKAYNSTILHVVYTCDTEIKLENGETIPCLEIEGKFNAELLEKYEQFLKSKKWIPCSGQLANFPKIKLSVFYSRLMIERLEEKTQSILHRLEMNKNDWEESFYQVLAGAFGLKVNQEIFQQLAESLPLKKVLWHHANLFQIEALLFGQAGLLQTSTFKDDYPRSLKKEYDYLSKKYNLKPLQGHLWKFLRIRPSGFPTLRISQFAALLASEQNLFSKILETKKVDNLKLLFNVFASAYWDTHFVWDKSTKVQIKKLSSDRVNLLLINVIVPFVFLYAKQRNKEKLMERALSFLEKLPLEKNKITAAYANEGIEFSSALQTQALLQLKSKYCDKRKCLTCPVGLFLIS